MGVLEELKPPNQNVKIVPWILVIIIVIVFLFVLSGMVYLALCLPFLYLCGRILIRLIKQNEKSIEHLSKMIIYLGLVFVSIVSVNYNETLAHNEVNLTNNTVALTKIATSLADVVVVFAAVVALIECIDSAIEYYDIKKKNPLYLYVIFVGMHGIFLLF